MKKLGEGDLEAEIERLRGQVEQYKHMCRYDWIQQQDRMIRELQDENERLREDAERYRWAIASRSKMAAWCIYKTPPQITNLIDAAIEAGQQQ